MPKKVLTGEVVSKKTDKTVIVMVVRTYNHKLYGKTVRIRKKYAVHDPENRFVEGDVVWFRESKPHSKTKKMEVIYNISDVG